MSDDQLTFTDITREQFDLYREVQESGVCNMLDWRTVEAETDYELDKDTQKVIRANYAALEGKYGSR